MIKINATIFWCFHNKHSAMSNKYEVTLGNLSEGAVKALTDAGLTVSDKTSKGMGMCITAKSNIALPVFTETGDSLEATMVGNGSKGIAIVTPYEWEYQKRRGSSPNLSRLVVTELVQFESAAKLASDNSAPAL